MEDSQEWVVEDETDSDFKEDVGNIWQKRKEKNHFKPGSQGCMHPSS